MRLRLLPVIAVVILIIGGAAAVILIGGGKAIFAVEDPYDPLLGGRNPRPGAENYLLSRNDIAKSDKDALLNLRPCPLDILKELADAPSREIRSLVAENPSVDEFLLEKLSADKEAGVRQYVAANPKTPRPILLKLSKDSDENVRWVVERNPNWTISDSEHGHKM